MNNDQSYLQKAIQYAVKCHHDTNHEYDGNGYGFHLAMVDNYVDKYIHLVDPVHPEVIHAAAWCHDLIEDTRQTYNDVKNVIGETAANIVYALTNEKGKNRKDRASEKYYTDMKKTPFAVFVKICDRLANVSHSRNTNSSMLNAYRKEQSFFKSILWDPSLIEMFNELESLFKTTI